MFRYFNICNFDISKYRSLYISSSQILTSTHLQYQAETPLFILLSIYVIWTLKKWSTPILKFFWNFFEIFFGIDDRNGRQKNWN